MVPSTTSQEERLRAILDLKNARKNLSPRGKPPPLPSWPPDVISSVFDRGPGPATVTLSPGLPSQFPTGTVTVMVESASGTEYIVSNSTQTLFTSVYTSPPPLAISPSENTGVPASTSLTSTPSSLSGPSPTSNGNLTNYTTLSTTTSMLSTTTSAVNTTVTHVEQSISISTILPSNPVFPTPPPASSSPAPSSISLAQRQTHINPGAIAGGVIAALIVIIICCFLLFRFLIRRRRIQNQNEADSSLIIPSALTTYNETQTSHDHDHGSSPEWYRPVTPAHSATLGFSTPASTVTETSATPLHSDHNVAQWAAAELPRQHEILMKENGEFWEEIEQLRVENEWLKSRAPIPVPMAF